MVSDCKAALVMAALRGDALVHTVCQVRMQNISDYPKPLDHKETMTSPDAEEWAKGLNVEFDSMKKTDRHSDPVQIPVNGKVIGTKWVYKCKRNLDRAVERYRDRLVGEGFSQVFG